MGTRWRGLLAPIDTPTGDGRRICEFTRRGLPLPHRWQREDETGHDRSVVVGLTDAMAFLTVADAVEQGWISPETARTLRPDMRGVFATGEFFDDVDPTVMPRLAQDAAEARFLAEKGVLGPSVGPGEAELYGVVHAGTRDRVSDAEAEQAQAEGRRLDTETLFNSYEIAESTLVPVPAFGETSAPFEIITDRQAADLALTAAMPGAVDLPVAARDLEWDGDAAKRRVFDHYTDGDTVDVDAVGRAFLWRDPDADPQTQSAYRLGFADIVDGDLRIVPRGVAATAGGHGVDAADIPAGDKARIKARICSLYGRVQAEHDGWPECPYAEARAAILAAAAAPQVDMVYPADVFDRPPGDRVVPLTAEPRRDGEDFQRVHGYVARWETCHTGILAQTRGVKCTTAPETRVDYALFHRYPVNTSGGLVAAGRLTTGFGRVGTGCTHLECQGKEDHGCDLMSIAEAIGHYDRLKTVAWVRATETPQGIWLSGATVDPELGDADRRVLARRKMSGDWRPHSGGFEMVEVLALAKEDPGFPIHLHRGRQTALLAAGAVVPDDDDDETPAAVDAVLSDGPELDLAERVSDMVVAKLRASEAGVTAAAPPPPSANLYQPANRPHTGAMVALVPTAEHAQRLAVMGGLPPDELHTTLLYLGDADQIPPETRERVVEMVRDWVENELRVDYDGSPVEADGFAISMFNPPSLARDVDRDPCVVLGLSGPDLDLVHELAESTVVASGLDVPEQHTPFIPHITLIYTDNTDGIGGYTDRVGPVEFDRLRVAFGGEVHDLPIAAGEEVVAADDEYAMTASAGDLTREVDALVAEIQAEHRAAAAMAFLAEIDAELTRYVRTPAGVRRYGLPIGSPIGARPQRGGGSRETVGGMERLTPEEQDLADELRDNGADVHPDGTVTVYHFTSPQSAEEIRRTGRMRGDEDGIFFTTKRDGGRATGYGEEAVTMRVPLRLLQLDDVFGDEAHVRVPTRRPR